MSEQTNYILKEGYNAEDNTLTFKDPKLGFIILNTYGKDDVSVWFTGTFKECNINDGICERGTIEDVLYAMDRENIQYGLDIITYLYKNIYEALKVDRKALKEYCYAQYLVSEVRPDTLELLMNFESIGMHIINPFMDSTARFEVEPIHEYGEDFLNSDFITEFIEKG